MSGATPPGWITPPNPQVAADYWVTRRNSDAAPGYGLGLPDFRARYRWVPDRGAWITGYYQGIQCREAMLSCLHSANGWRIEQEGPFDHEDYGDVCVRREGHRQ